MSRKLVDSGIEWIGKIPEDWKVTKLKFLYRDTIAGEVIDKSYWNEGKEMLYTCQATPIISNFNKFPNRKRTKENDLLLTRNATPYVFVPKINSIYSNVVQKITINNNSNKKFVKYALICGVNHLKVNGDTIPSWNMNIWNNIEIPLISLKSQNRIVDYLDKKCFKIDDIVEGNKKEIKLLEEYRKNIISKVVFNGLENAEYNKLNLLWLDKIPNTWNLINIRSLFEFRKGLSITKDSLINDGVSVISYGQIHSKLNDGTKILDSFIRYVAKSYLETDNNCLAKKNDFIFADTSEDLEGCGNSVFIDRNENIFAGYHTIIVHPIKEITKYYAYLFSTDKWRSQIRSLVNGVKLYSITQRILKSCKIIVPSLKEQNEIVVYLDNICSKLDKVIEYRKQIIEKLEEYKKSLIYEVVTGKKEV